MTEAPRNFKVGLEKGVDKRRFEKSTTLRKKREERLAMRRGTYLEIENRPQSSFESFRAFKDFVLERLAHGSYEEKLFALSEFLHHADEDSVLVACPEVLQNSAGEQLLVSLVELVKAGPTTNRLHFEVAINCITTIMYQPQNVAFVEVLCREKVHLVALRYLANIQSNDGLLRSSILQMLGNLARNNMYARDMMLGVPDLIAVLGANLQDGYDRQDFSLIGVLFYMMFSLCESSHGGETPPLALFDPLMPLFIQIIEQVDVEHLVQTQDDEQKNVAIGACAFLEAICLANGTYYAETEGLIEMRKEGIIRLTQNDSVVQFLLRGAQSQVRHIQTKSISTLCYMCNIGIAVCKIFTERYNILSVLSAALSALATSPYARLQIFKTIFKLSKFGLAQNASIMALLEQSLLHSNMQASLKRYAVWTLCQMIKFAENEPDVLKHLVHINRVGFVLGSAMNTFVVGGDQETLTSISRSLILLLRYRTDIVRDQLEESGAINLLARIQHTAHVESQLYQDVETIEDYF